MRKMLWAVMPFLLALHPAGAEENKGPDKELAKLQGTWTVSSGERDGQKLPDDMVKGYQVVIKDRKFTLFINGNEDHEETMEIDPGKDPKQITLTAKVNDQKKTFKGIYALDGGTLKLCIALADRERPAKFPAKDTKGLFILVLTRK